jgi:hypothetical protein
MKKIISISTFLVFLISCGKNDLGSSKIIYQKKSKDSKFSFSVTFLNDSTCAVNADNLTDSGWGFIKTSSNDKGYYLVMEQELDTTWLKFDNDKLLMINSQERDTLLAMDMIVEKTNNIFKRISRVKKLSEKNIVFTDEIGINEVDYFYSNAVNKIKENLKNPSEAKFIKTFIHTSDVTIDKTGKKVNAKVVSLDVESTNGFGGISMDNFYVYFIPHPTNKNRYEAHFSTYPVYRYQDEEKDDFSAISIDTSAVY